MTDEQTKCNQIFNKYVVDHSLANTFDVAKTEWEELFTRRLDPKSISCPCNRLITIVHYFVNSSNGCVIAVGASCKKKLITYTGVGDGSRTSEYGGIVMEQIINEEHLDNKYYLDRLYMIYAEQVANCRDNPRVELAAVLTRLCNDCKLEILRPLLIKVESQIEKAQAEHLQRVEEDRKRFEKARAEHLQRVEEERLQRELKKAAELKKQELAAQAIRQGIIDRENREKASIAAEKLKQQQQHEELSQRAKLRLEVLNKQQEQQRVHNEQLNKKKAADTLLRQQKKRQEHNEEMMEKLLAENEEKKRLSLNTTSSDLDKIAQLITKKVFVGSAEDTEQVYTQLRLEIKRHFHMILKQQERNKYLANMTEYYDIMYSNVSRQLPITLPCNIRF
jgi:hypothetical protein